MSSGSIIVVAGQTGLFQKYNDIYVKKLALINTLMIIFAFFITILGLFLSKDIKKQENDLIRLMVKAKEANKAKSEFLANMSHEIRTPMNSVIGFSELLKESELSTVQKQYIDAIYSSGQGLLGIINDILDFSKIEAGKLELELVRTDIIELAELSTDLIKYSTDQKGLELLCRIDPEIPRFAWVDPIRLKQILTNLLSNAMKFTKKGKIELDVEYKQNGERGLFTFSISDTGIGLTDKQQQKLFQAFSQADSSTTRKFGGTGLGLVISEQLAKKMGSKILIESTLGKGAKFYFTIEAKVEKNSKIRKETFKRIKRVLIIDDNENNRTLLEHLMNTHSISHESCDNGLESLKIIKQKGPFDVVICDYHMPFIDGLKTIKMIREKLKLSPKEQPIILLHSSIDDTELQEKSHHLGIQFKLTKPVKQTELFNAFISISTDSLGD